MYRIIEIRVCSGKKGPRRCWCSYWTANYKDSRRTDRNAKHIVPERNSVGRSEAIRRVIEDLLRRHLVADGVVHIQVERLLGFGQLLPEEDALSSKGVEHGASLSGQKFGVGISNLFLAVVDPVILACAKKCVLALKV